MADEEFGNAEVLAVVNHLSIRFWHIACNYSDIKMVLYQGS